MARVVFQGLQIVRGVIGPVAVPKHLAQRAVILSAAGQYGDFTKADSLSLGGQLKVRDMQAIGALLDQT